MRREAMSTLAVWIVFVGMLASLGLLMALVVALAEVVQRVLRGLGI